MLLSATPWPSSTPDDKLNQIMDHVLTLGGEVKSLRADNVALRADNVALSKKVTSQGDAIERLKSRVHTIEGENQELRQAIDGVGALI